MVFKTYVKMPTTFTKREMQIKTILKYYFFKLSVGKDISIDDTP